MSTSNFLSPVEFRLVTSRLPNIEFYVQGANIPGIGSNAAETGTPFKTLPFSGVRPAFDDFIVSVLADEDLLGFREISAWLVSLTFPDSFDQYEELSLSPDSTTSDMTLMILNSNKNANLEVKFKNVFPIAVSGIQMNTRETDIVAPTFDITFKYDSYVINKLA